MNDSAIIRLKKKLSRKSIIDVFGEISLLFLGHEDGPSIVQEKTSLCSPYRQCQYIAGLLVSTDDKTDLYEYPIDFSFNDICGSVDKITSEYWQNFFKFDATDDKEYQKISITMSAFGSYFETGDLRYEEQTLQVLLDMYAPYEDYLIQSCGLSISDMFEIADYFGKVLNKHFVEFEDFMRNMQELFVKGVNIANQNENSFIADGCCCVKVSEISAKFGVEKTKAFFNLFGIKRFERDFLFYTGDNPIKKQPLCYVEKHDAYAIAYMGFLTEAIQNYIIDCMESSLNPKLNKVLNWKGKVIESKTVSFLKTLLGSSAKIHQNVCEQIKTNEHDILVEYKDYLLLCEVKAAKVRAPLFSPDKAFPRIKKDLWSSSGIGHAYLQSLKLKHLLQSSNEVSLFENMNKRFFIDNLKEKKIIMIVVTLNKYGAIAVNPELFIDNKLELPWICNIFDLENISKIFKYLDKDGDDFIDYLLLRTAGKYQFTNDDELDIVECYCRNREQMNQECDFFQYTTDGINLSDLVYFTSSGLKYDHPFGKVIV